MVRDILIPNGMTSLGLQGLLEAIGRGRVPSGMQYTEDGLVDLRGLELPRAMALGKFRTPGGTFAYTPGKPTLRNLALENLDLSRSVLAGSLWLDCTFRNVRVEGAKCQGVNFASSNMDHVTFTRTDLTDAHWGQAGLDGPVVSNVEFVDADLQGSTYGHPRFLHCRWVNCNLRGVKFRGSRFEHCAFIGPLDRVWFKGRDRDPDPRIAGLRNPMTEVDFSAAELRWPNFTHGIDLTSCKFPPEGYLRVPHPRATYGLVLDRVRESLVGKEREAAVFFLEGLLKGHFKEEQPLDILRPQDLVESPMGRGAAMGILERLEEVLGNRSTRGGLQEG